MSNIVPTQSNFYLREIFYKLIDKLKIKLDPCLSNPCGQNGKCIPQGNNEL
jgi:hypothetical protein